MDVPCGKCIWIKWQNKNFYSTKSSMGLWYWLKIWFKQLVILFNVPADNYVQKKGEWYYIIELAVLRFYISILVFSVILYFIYQKYRIIENTE